MEKWWPRVLCSVISPHTTAAIFPGSLTPPPPQQQQPRERQVPCPLGTAAPPSGILLAPCYILTLTEQLQKPNLWVWTVSWGISDRLWGGAISSIVFGTLLVLLPHGRPDRNSQLPANTTGLHMRGSGLLRSGKYSQQTQMCDSQRGEHTRHLP